MLHPDPIESSPKTEPPPHPGDARNTKKVKLGDGEEMDILMDEDCSPSLAAETTLAPATLDSEMVPETQAPLPMSNAMETNVMSVDSHHDNGKIPSFKDKLLNADKDNTEEEEEVVLKKGDVEIGMEGNIPTVNFAVHVLEALNQRMGLAVVVKLLGRQIGYAQLRIQLQNIWKPTGRFKLTDLDDDCFLVRFTEDIDFQNALLNGPWVIFGHYLTVQPWSPSFKPQEHVIKQVIGWIRLPRLPARYYHKSIIRSIGSVFGDVIRVDYNTESGDRGKFARLAVVIDLTKPLISKILVDGEVIYVEYEGLPLICFNCGRYGHLQEVCPEKMAQAPIDQSVILPERVQQEEREQAQFGAWMQVPRRRRIYSRGGRKEADVGSKGIPTTSRYEALYEATAQLDDRPGVYDSVILQQNGEGIPTRRKSKDLKATKRTDTGHKKRDHKADHINEECIFASPHFKSTQIPTKLDTAYNTAVFIQDDRQIQRTPKAGVVEMGQSSRGKAQFSHMDVEGIKNKPPDPKSTNRGVKLGSGLTIDKLGAKPNENREGPSVKLAKEIARSLHAELSENAFAALVEGGEFPSNPID